MEVWGTWCFFCIQNTSEGGLLAGLKRSGGTKKRGYCVYDFFAHAMEE